MTKRQREKFYLIESKVLPEVFKKVILVKEGIQKKIYPSINQAVKAVGISRSAYYKYHKSVFLYHGTDLDSVDMFNLIVEVDLVSPHEVIISFENNNAKIISLQQSPVTKGLSTIQIICRDLEKTKSTKIVKHLTKISGIVQVNHHPIHE